MKIIVIRPADKGSSVVVQNTESYDAEVRRQPDHTFYRPLDRDPTLSHNELVTKAVDAFKWCNQ